MQGWLAPLHAALTDQGMESLLLDVGPCIKTIVVFN